MFTKLRCFYCNKHGRVFMDLREFSSFYCSDCDSQYYSDEVAECINGRRDGRGIANTTEQLAQLAEWQKVLDFIQGR